MGVMESLSHGGHGVHKSWWSWSPLVMEVMESCSHGIIGVLRFKDSPCLFWIVDLLPNIVRNTEL